VRAALSEELERYVPPRVCGPAQLAVRGAVWVEEVAQVGDDFDGQPDRREQALARLLALGRARRPRSAYQRTPTRSTTKISVSPGAIAPPAPRSP
jgi:hypothetical protein